MQLPSLPAAALPFVPALCALVWVPAGGALVSGGSAAAPRQGRRADWPNVLWPVAEDFGNQLSCAGTKEVWTPNLDRLAAEGVRSPRFYTTAPVCSPSRSAF